LIAMPILAYADAMMPPLSFRWRHCRAFFRHCHFRLIFHCLLIIYYFHFAAISRFAISPAITFAFAIIFIMPFYDTIIFLIYFIFHFRYFHILLWYRYYY
jgi:hypothetical protein